MISAGEGTCGCGKTGPLVVDPFGGAPTCERCYQPPPRGTVDSDTSAAFAIFAAEWKRVGMPGEPRQEPDGSASVAPESWGCRAYYHIASAGQVLAGFPAAEEADDETESAICEALGVSACIRRDPTVCTSCGGNLTCSDPNVCTCDSCGATFRRDGDQWRKDTPRRRRHRRSVEQLLALAAAGDHRGLYTSLLAALPRCMGECGRPSRYMTTYSGEFSCGRAGCETPDADGDKWMAAPWKDHVDAAEALSQPRGRTRRNKTAAASALEVTANDRAMASGHNLMFKHEDEVGGVAVGPASWVEKGSTIRRAGYVREKAGNPRWFSISEVRAFATMLGTEVVDV